MLRIWTVFALVALTFFGGNNRYMMAQRRPVQPAARYYHLICVVHMTGTGREHDPIRPEYVPLSIDADRSGILAWKIQLADNKEMAIVHLVATNRGAFARVLGDARPEIRVFEPGRQRGEVVENELKKYKKDFSLANFEVTVQ